MISVSTCISKSIALSKAKPILLLGKYCKYLSNNVNIPGKYCKYNK